MERVTSGIKSSIKKSEKLFKTDITYLLKGGSWLSFEKVVILLISFGTSIAFANLLSKELFGNYKYLMSLASILGALSLTGLSSVVVRAAAKGYEGVFLKAVKLYLKWSWPSVVFGLIAAAYYLFNENMTLGISLIVIALTNPILHAMAFYRPYLNGKKLFNATSTFGIINSAVPHAILVGVLFVTDSIILIVGSYLISNTLVTYLLFRLAVKRYPPNHEVDGNTWMMGKHISVMNTVAMIVSKLDALLLFQFFGGTQLAIYTFAVAMPDSIRGSFKMLTALAVPKFAKRNVDSLKQIVLKRTKQFFVIAGIIAGLYVLAAPYIFQLLFPAYMDAVFYSQLYAITIALNSLFASSFLDVQVAIRERYISHAVANGTLLVTMVPLTLLFGVMGAIVARIITRVISIAVSIYIVWSFKPNEIDK